MTALSLGEQPHDPARCDRGGRPHLGPCVAAPRRVHPGPSAYNRGCRCEECVELHKLRMRRVLDEMAARGRADPSLIPHGTRGGYNNWSCRCDPCTDAQMAACKDWRQRAARAS
jgi:hypothetical protein